MRSKVRNEFPSIKEQIGFLSAVRACNMTPVNTCMFLKLIKRLAHLLRRHIKILHSQVDLFVDVHAGNDKEHPRTTGTFKCMQMWNLVSSSRSCSRLVKLLWMRIFSNDADFYILTSWKQTTKSKDDSAFVLLLIECRNDINYSSTNIFSVFKHKSGWSLSNWKILNGLFDWRIANLALPLEGENLVFPTI